MLNSIIVNHLCGSHSCLLVSTQVTTGGFVSEEHASDMEKFFAENPWAKADRVIKQNCEVIRRNAKWLEKNKEAVKEWLATQ